MKAPLFASHQQYRTYEFVAYSLKIFCLSCQLCPSNVPDACATDSVMLHSDEPQTSCNYRGVWHHCGSASRTLLPQHISCQQSACSCCCKTNPTSKPQSKADTIACLFLRHCFNACLACSCDIASMLVFNETSSSRSTAAFSFALNRPTW